jgi:phosphotransferase system enzyme I (PtsI)
MSRANTKIMSKSGRTKETVLHGIGVSPGIAVGQVYLVGTQDDYFVARVVSDSEIPGEISRLEDALIDTRRQIKEIQRNVGTGMRHGEMCVLDVHLSVLDDRVFVEEVLQQIQSEHQNAEASLWVVADKYMAVLAGLEDDYLRERVADIKDVARRISRNLTGAGAVAVHDVSAGTIIIANDLAPSETAALPKDKVIGLATDLGSPTSHSAVMARAMQIPAVVGMHDITGRLATGDEILMDGNKGLLIINPTPSRMRAYGKVIEERRHIESDLTTLKNLPAETTSGGRVVLSANIESATDVASVVANGAEGVGLFRSEYLYMSGNELPTEDELYEVYKSVVVKLAPSPVIIRTLDIGGDKIASYMDLPREVNPFLGCRSIRFSLAVPEIFKTQLRAILRAGAHGNAKIMYPMISNSDEVVQANAILAEAAEELRVAGTPYDAGLEVGVMIETPSAALTADLIAPHVKFFSLGTNDLIQYTIAVDRVNEQLAYLYQPTHPAILRLIQATVASGHAHGIWVGVCGEMAGDPVLGPLLVGLGVDELSASPAAVPVVKNAIRSVSTNDAEKLAAAAMSSKNAADVLKECRKLIRRVAPEILELTG